MEFLLVFSIYAFLFRHILLAIASLAVAATFHPTYIPSAALLGLAYMVETYREEKSLKNVILIGSLSFTFLLPVVLYMSLVFAPTTPELWQQAQDIIVNFRIPHHSFPEIWLSKQPVASTVQILVMVVGIHLMRGTRLFLPLCIPFIAGVLLTFLQVLGGDNTVAFVAPWRISAFLVPVCTSIILARIICYCLPEEPQHRPSRYIAIFLSLAVLAFCTVRGAAITKDRFADRDATAGMMDFVKANKQPSDVYLVPFNTTEIWRMQRFWKFRLYTGAPIFINEKSHPYKDLEVLEWYRRVILAQQFYQATDASRCETLPSLRGNEKITHIVFAPEHPPIPCAEMEELYNDGAHSVYRILP
ncbi:hypothetical protein HC928_19250 [bacterium]|nr:hypothetical protein [bacterium]